MRKVLLIAAAAAAGLLLSAAAALWWLAGTEAGARRAVVLLDGALAGDLSVERLEGTLFGPLVLHGVRYATDAMEAEVGSVRLQWRPRALLRRRLDVTRLEIHEVRVATRSGPTKKQAAGLPDIHLPVNVIVRDARIEGVRIEDTAGARPFVVDSVHLSTSDIRGTVRIETLEARGPTFTAGVKGTLRPAGDYPVDLEVAWTFTPEGASAAWSGSARLRGTLEDLRIVHDLASPAAVHFEAAVRKPLRDASFEAAATFTDVSTGDLSPKAPPAVASGRIEASGTPARFRARGTLDAHVRAADLGRVRAELEIERSGNRWTLERSVLTLPGTPARVVARGEARLAGETPVFDVAFDWTKLSYPLRGKTAVRSESGRAAIRGTSDAYTLTVDAAIGGDRVPAGRWRIEGSGGPSALSIAKLAVDTLGGTIRGSGRVAWSPSAAWELALSGEDLDPSAFAADYPGRIGFEATTSGRVTEGGPEGRVELARLDGTLRGRPVAATATVALAGKTYRIGPARAEVAGAKAEASGLVGERLDLEWTLDAPDLSSLLAGASGSLRASGELSGRPSAPRMAVEAAGEKLAWGERRAGSLRLDGDFATGNEGPLRLDLEAKNVVAVPGREALHTVTAALRGSRASHTLRVDASDDDGRLALALAAAGKLDGKSWTGEVRTLDFRTPESGRWTLASAVPLSYSDRGASIEGFCWISGSARLCADAERRADGGFSLEATLRRLPLALLSPWLAPGVSITGELEGTVSARAASGSGLELAALLTAQGGRLRYGDSEGQSVEYRGARLEVRTRGRSLEATASIPLPGVGDLTAAARLPRYADDIPNDLQTLEGRVNADVASLAALAAFLPQAEGLGGRLTADWTLAGTLGAPRLSGALRLTGGRATLLETGTQLRDVELAVTGDGRGPLTVEGSARARDGEIRIAGRVPMPPSESSPVELTITGRRFMALDTYERRMELTPDLELRFDGRVLSATGDVRVPMARFEYLSRLAAVPRSPDVEVVGRAAEGTPAAPRYAVEARVRLVLGEQVRVKAMGFEGRVRGSLLLEDRPGRPPSGTGEIVVDEGTYEAYGAELTIERGRLRFAGRLDNPGLDLKAFRKADDGTIAGVIVQGSLRKPDVEVYSEPPMSESDALAYVILGHPLDQASPAEGSLVSRVATSAGITAANLLGRQAARQFGFETVRIESDNGGLEEASLVVGKYLSPRIYLEYGIGLIDQASQLRVNYILNKRWSLRAETGKENAGDVFYTIER